jgi:hypothetical protein
VNSVFPKSILEKEYIINVNNEDVLEFGMERIWHLFHYCEDNDILIKKLQNNFALEHEQIEKIAKINLKEGYSNISLKALRYFLFGFGELTKSKANILNKIAAGEKVEIDNEFFGNAMSPSYKQQGLILNSMKLAYGDGKTYLKMSAAVLTPELTSVKRNGEWVAKEGREAMHNLRMKLENYENEQWEKGIGVLGIAVPASASKMMKVKALDTYSLDILKEYCGENYELIETHNGKIFNFKRDWARKLVWKYCTKFGIKFIGDNLD